MVYDLELEQTHGLPGHFHLGNQVEPRYGEVDDWNYATS